MLGSVSTSIKPGRETTGRAQGFTDVMSTKGVMDSWATPGSKGLVASFAISLWKQLRINKSTLCVACVFEMFDDLPHRPADPTGPRTGAAYARQIVPS